MNAKQWMVSEKIDPLPLMGRRLRVVALSVNIHRPESVLYEGIFKGFDDDGNMVFGDKKTLMYSGFDMLTRLWEMK
jgi:hypothetical protein